MPNDKEIKSPNDLRQIFINQQQINPPGPNNFLHSHSLALIPSSDLNIQT